MLYRIKVDTVYEAVIELPEDSRIVSVEQRSKGER